MTPKSTSRQQKQEHLLRTQLYVFEQALMHQIEPSLSRYKADCLYLTLYGLKQRFTEPPPPDLSHSTKVGLGKEGIFWEIRSLNLKENFAKGERRSSLVKFGYITQTCFPLVKPRVMLIQVCLGLVLLLICAFTKANDGEIYANLIKIIPLRCRYDRANK